MNVVEWLENVEKLDALIEAKRREKKQLLELVTSITPGYSDMPGGTDVSDRVGNGAVKLAMKEQEIDRAIEKHLEHKSRVIRALERLPAKEYAVLHRFYIQYMTLEKISEELGICYMTAWRRKESGIKKLESVIDCYI